MHHHFSDVKSRPAHRLCRADARVKVVTAVVLLVMVISCKGIVFPLLVALFSLGLCFHLGVPAKRVLLRFAEPAFIACTLLLLKIFCAGKVPLFTLHLWGLEVLAHRDGLLEGAVIASRIAGGVSVLAVVGYSTQFTELMAALSWLKVPKVFLEISLFAWRYLFLLLDDAHVVYSAQKNRLGYAGYRRGLRSFGTLAGVLVLKAFDSSQSMTTAMVQRGYTGELPMLQHHPFVAAEVLFSVLLVSGMAVLRSL
ncbi:cobalt ECF transporter T component CbiQ [Geomonas sp. RF6]|uniref:cobalt ECF transporter T component CbiQ n=1 Tax=Geomonas sp. RF6 TaxID=2897342 RepID=UPI001E47521D|nr:cobalt ECF transporter T component CbiQ [Geomonas sp. RF6]UFS72358.1 cobalt ECF transporter T component CbiQ [Geomonas sp. RF6]